MKTLKSIIITAIILVSINVQARPNYMISGISVGWDETNYKEFEKLLVEQDSFRTKFYVKVQRTRNGLYKKLVFGDRYSFFNSFHSNNVFKFKPSKNFVVSGDTITQDICCIKKVNGKKVEYKFTIIVDVATLDLTIIIFEESINENIIFNYTYMY